jgi:DNA-binding CsgD family transcriptional regulator
MTLSDPLASARDAVARTAWADAFSAFAAADAQGLLGPVDLELLAHVTWLVGKEGDSAGVGARAYQGYVNVGDSVAAARCAFWIGFSLLQRGEMAQGGGWLARAEGHLEGVGDCVERGYVLLPRAQQALEGAADSAHAAFLEIGEIASRFHDPDLMALSLLGRGEALIQLGEPHRGMSLLDEAMVAVTARETSPIVAGIVYCTTIDTCRALFDIGRAREWTAALHAWCESQQDLAPFRGACLVYRAELMQLAGAWPDALREAQQAHDRLVGEPGSGAGDALYVLGDLHRLRGEFTEAESAYRRSNAAGRRPDPGMALLRLAQGQLQAAEATMRRALGETREPQHRARLLGAFVDVTVAVGDLQTARVAADELVELSARISSTLLGAEAARAMGAVQLAAGEVRTAIEALRRAAETFRLLDQPYEMARTRVLIGSCCRELGDDEAARLEFDAALTVFQRLGAAPDAAHLERLLVAPGASAVGGLTEREREVLRLLASGKTNRAIAVDLVISEKTVARHVSNIFNKLGLSSRAAATAYAYEHGLQSPSA